MNLMTFLITIQINHSITILNHFVTVLKQKVFHHVLVHVHQDLKIFSIFSIFSVYVTLIFTSFNLLIFESLSSKHFITFSLFIQISSVQLQFMSLKNFMKQVTSNLLLFSQLMQTKMTLFQHLLVEEHLQQRVQNQHLKRFTFHFQLVLSNL